MKTDTPGRLLGIGEFAAATQLSLKALRLYDEQRLLRPAAVDAANGYRYYRHDQIAAGRLIRLLRDMDLPLAAVADIVAGDATSAEAALRQSAQNLEQRFTHQRRAFRAALAQLRHVSPGDTPAIESRRYAAATLAVRPFLAERRSLLERFRAETAVAESVLGRAGIAPIGEPACSLLDPLSDEEGRLELLLPIPDSAMLPGGIAVRRRPETDRAVIVVEFAPTDAVDLTAGIDTLFDWFDRHGHHALEPPEVTFESRAAGVKAEIHWTYE